MTTPPPLPAPDPEINIETQPFWDAAAQGEMHLPRCDDCGTVIWYPRAVCPECHGTNTTWFRASGRGSVYSYTVVHRSLGVYADATPYVVGYVELEEGPRVLTNIVECAPADVRIGMPVEVVFHPTESGVALHRFRPAEAPPG